MHNPVTNTTKIGNLEISVKMLKNAFYNALITFKKNMQNIITNFYFLFCSSYLEKWRYCLLVRNATAQVLCYELPLPVGLQGGKLKNNVKTIFF